MSIDFSFVEYSAPLSLREYNTQRLGDLGFVPRVNHMLHDITLWCQNHTILMVKHTDTVVEPGISGLGFIADQHVIDDLEPDYDQEAGMFVTGDMGNLRILLAPVNDILGLQKTLEENYIMLDDQRHANPGLKYITGVRYNNCDPRMMDFYQDNGFSFTRSTDNYNTLISKNRRFSMMCNKLSNTGNVTTLICDTDDVFVSTAGFVASGVELAKYHNQTQNLNFGKLNHKVVGYDCLAEGTEDSYSIENFIPEALPNLDVIFRMRKRYMNIAEHTLDYHYEQQPCDR
jgi:hypothetical protein